MTDQQWRVEMRAQMIAAGHSAEVADLVVARIGKDPDPRAPRPQARWTAQAIKSFDRLLTRATLDAAAKRGFTADEVSALVKDHIRRNATLTDASMKQALGQIELATLAANFWKDRTCK